MYINTFQYKPEHVDCTLRTEYTRKKGCTSSPKSPLSSVSACGENFTRSLAPPLPTKPEKRLCGDPIPCPWLAERIEAGVVGYKEAVMKTFPCGPYLEARLNTAVRRFSGSLFLSPDHYRRMEQKVHQYCRYSDTPACCAAMYLLTANEDICTRTANCFCRYGIEFDYAITRDISPHNYTLLSAARDIYSNGSSVTLSDLALSEIVDTLAFILIVNALLIARYGCAVLKISGREGKE